MVPATDERALGMLRADGRVCILVQKGRESFFFWYDDASCAEVVYAASKWWANEELNFDGFDARQIASCSQREFLLWWPSFVLENQIANSFARRMKGESR